MDKNIFNLQLFAEGGDGGADASAGGDATGVKAPDAGVQPNNRRKQRVNPLADVHYGIQGGAETPAQESTPGTTNGTETESFEDLIKGKYKADFDARVQTIISNRFKANAENEAQLENYKRFAEAAGKKLNVDPSDLEALTQAVLYDEAELEQEAVERGITVESLKTIKDLEAKNRQYAQREQQSIAEQKLRTHYNSLAQQGEEVKALYPGFDFAAEMQNPNFVRLTAPGVGVSVKQAYELVHMDEIKAQAAQQQAKAFAASVQANGARPVENGLTGEQGASTVKTDPRTLTPADRAEIKRRVARGDRITF